MMHISRLNALGILLTALLVGMLAVPNLFSEQTVKGWPTWAQRQVVLGLDLRGGSHLLLEVDTAAIRKERLEQLREDVRRVLRADAGLTLVSAPVVRGNGVEVVVREGDLQTALAKARELARPFAGVAGSAGQPALDVAHLGGGRIQIALTEPALIARVRQTVEQSIPVIEKRINELGTVEPSIQRQGIDRIMVQVPGYADPEQLERIITAQAKLDFRMVDESMTPEQAAASRPPESEILFGTSNDGHPPYLIEKRVLVSGADLVDAQPGFHPSTGEPIVNFRFSAAGARKFAQVTTENVGRRFAAVLDREVLTAPVIKEPILQGTGQISGSFTAKSANDLAILMRAGALPAKLTTIDKKFVGASVGQDSINKGRDASYYGAALVIVFMVVTYGLFGVFASVAVAVNVAMIFGVLSLLGATLTLPGIIGIVLTIGIAVDSNVLIYERIREEVRGGRTPITAIDAGFTRALATILDSNITTFIAAAVLFFIGTGPVRGFAVTLGIGILTTVFTAFTLTRLMVAWWVRWVRPQQLAIS